MADTSAWFPTGMAQEDIDLLLEAYPGDPHRAAADAWYDYAATLPAVAEATSVSTGAQSVSYAAGSSPAAGASARGDWHMARAKVKSVRVGPTVEIEGYAEVQREVAEFYDDGDDLLDAGTIETVFYPPVGG